MTHIATIVPADVWLLQMFSAKSAREGGIVRPQIRDVEMIVGRDRFEREIRRRGYHAIENAGQMVIFCNNDHVRIIC